MPKQLCRWIVHVDVDAFFASVEQVLRPELRDKPVIVGGVPEIRGCVCSASYDARALGVKVGMSLRQAQKLCPGAVFVPGRFADYGRFSRQLYSLLCTFTPEVEAASIDDMYLDLTGCERLYGEIERAASMIQKRTLQELGLGISMGVASSKVVARIASGLRKPKGLVVVPHGREELFLAPLPLSKLPGIGRPTERRLHELGIHTIGELAALPKELLLRAFGSVGGLLHERARGFDGRGIIGARIPKSISRETTFEQDTIDGAFIRSVLKYLCERVGMSLRRLGRQCRTITGKVRYGDFGQIVRSRTLPAPTDDDVTLFREVLALFSQIHTRKVAVRLVGVAVSGLITVGRQSDLLDLNGDKRGRINEGIDRIRSKYGFNAIDYGDTMQLRRYYSEDEGGLRLKTPSLSR